MGCWGGGEEKGGWGSSVVSDQVRGGVFCLLLFLFIFYTKNSVHPNAF